MKLNKNLLVGFGFASMALVSCGSDDDASGSGDDNPVVSEFVIEDEQASAVAQRYSDLARQTYSDALTEAQLMETAITAFVTTPSQETFDAAKAAWLTAREVYGVSEAFRLADGPIDRVDENNVEGPEGLLNSWPMDENFVDYVQGADGIENSGYINDTGFVLSAEALEAENGATSEAQVAVGWHAIEFLLWGQDNTDPIDNMQGLRAYTDYLTTDEATADNGDRRGEYLNIVTGLLIDNLEFVLNEWTEGENYDVTFSELSNEQLLTNILSGIGKFANGELRGERIIPGFGQDGSQEDEHSCFSDNTHVDIARNYEGIRNIYFGEYEESALAEGMSVDALVELADSEVAANVRAAFNAADAAVTAATSGDAVPFDRAILSIEQGNTEERRALINDAITTLGLLGNELTEAASALGLNAVTGEFDELPSEEE